MLLDFFGGKCSYLELLGILQAATPGALFEDKPQSANDAWRKLHSDPLLLIRQREQEALARIKNNPIRMAMIRKSVEAEKKNKQDDKVKKKKKQHKRKHKKSNEKDSVSEISSESEEATQRGHHLTSERQAKGKRSKYPSNVGEEEEGRRKDDNLKYNRKHSDSKHEKHSSRIHSDSRYSSESEEDRRKGVRSISEHHSRHPSNNVREEERRKGDRDRLISDDKHGYSKHVKHSSGSRSDSKYLSESEEDRRKGGSSISEHHRKYNHSTNSTKRPENEEEKRKHVSSTSDRYNPSSEPGSGNKNWETQPQNRQGPGYNRRRGVPKMTEEEREARLREMQLDAELHEEQRWKRVKKAAEADALESARASSSGGKNFLDAAQKSIYGTEKGGSSTIEESVRRRAYFSQGGTVADESNAFRR